MPNKSPDKSPADLKFPFCGMTPENGRLIMDTMRELYGEVAEDMTLVEVMKRHPDLIAKLGGERGFVKGKSISNESMMGLTHKSELNEAVRGERGRVMEIKNGRLNLPEEL